MNKSIFSESIVSGGTFYGIDISETKIDLLYSYYELVRSWNEKTNLISSGDLERFVSYHILDSFKTNSLFDFSGNKSLLDFGSGAGIPGIPLLIAFPEIKLTLIDSRKKRCEFLSHASEILNLPFNVIFSRAESLSHDFDNSFDIVITRATVSLIDYLNICGRFIHSGGSLISIKGDSIDDEYSDLSKFSFKQVFNISKASPPEYDNVRTGNVIIINKF